MAFSKRAQSGKIINRPQGGGPIKSGIPSSIGHNRQIVFKLKSRVYSKKSRKNLNGRLSDGPISGATITLKSLNGTTIDTTITDTNGYFAFNADALQPNTYYLLESSLGKDIVTNINTIGLSLLMKTANDNTANVVISPVSTILKTMVSSDNASLNTLTTSQIDALVSQNKTDLNVYLETGNNSINNIESIDFYASNNLDLYKENAAIYSYLMTTNEILANTLDEREPIIELVDTITRQQVNPQQNIGGLLISGLSSYANTLTVSNNGQTLTDTITSINTATTTQSLNTILSSVYSETTYPKQYDWDLIKTIDVSNSAYGIGVDTSGRYISYTSQGNGPIVCNIL
jgi:hypothetical protein